MHFSYCNSMHFLNLIMKYENMITNNIANTYADFVNHIKILSVGQLLINN